MGKKDTLTREATMTTKIAINGYGRIGRCFHRLVLDNPDKGLEIVAINDLTDATTLAHLLKYDSVHGALRNSNIKADGNNLVIEDKVIPVLSMRDPAELPWKKLGVDMVLESTGVFRTTDSAGKHITAGAKKVVLSAPGKGGDVGTFVMGVNHETYDPAKHHVFSNASCTTNCLAPTAKVLDELATLQYGQMLTIHSYTNDQRILDLPHKDLRRARAAAVSMIPTTTGAARAVGLVLPHLKGKLDGFAIRVPTFNVSIVELVAQVERKVTVDQVKEAYKKAADGPLKGILNYTEEPLVSVDINGDPASATFDAPLTMIMGENQVKVCSWYDNEWGYSARLVDLMTYVSSKS
jgi:glyceraldehyde 3-phosphate dehydrogenase